MVWLWWGGGGGGVVAVVGVAGLWRRWRACGCGGVAGLWLWWGGGGVVAVVGMYFFVWNYKLELCKFNRSNIDDGFRVVETI